GMFCLEGTGAISHLSIRNAPDFFNEPPVFAALVVKGQPKTARVLEGPVPDWKKYSMSQAGLGDVGRTWGLARYRNATFRATFPFAEVSLNDAGLPAEVRITGWSPFIPTDPDNSSLPMGALEYRIANRSPKTLEYIFSFNSPTLPSFSQVRRTTGGFVLSEDSALAPDKKGDLAFFTDDPAAVVDYCWFRGGWWDPLTMAWNHIRDATVQAKDPQPNSSGASIEVPFTLKPGEVRTIRLMITWYVPDSRLRIGENVSNPADSTV